MLYVIKTEAFGDLLLTEDSIKAARKRARAMFGKLDHTVYRAPSENVRMCSRCGSHPCCCTRKEVR